MEDYRTVRGTATGEYEEKKSRFIAQLSFADSEEAAVAFLEQVRAANRTARHNVYAYRLRAGNRERYSDDGEPAKTFVSESEGLKILDEAFTVEEYAIAVKKGNSELLDKINTALESLKDNGTLDEIVAKYIKAE